MTEQDKGMAELIKMYSMEEVEVCERGYMGHVSMEVCEHGCMGHVSMEVCGYASVEVKRHRQSAGPPEDAAGRCWEPSHVFPGNVVQYHLSTLLLLPCNP